MVSGKVRRIHSPNGRQAAPIRKATRQPVESSISGVMVLLRITPTSAPVVAAISWLVGCQATTRPRRSGGAISIR